MSIQSLSTFYNKYAPSPSQMLDAADVSSIACFAIALIPNYRTCSLVTLAITKTFTAGIECYKAPSRSEFVLTALNVSWLVCTIFPHRSLMAATLACITIVNYAASKNRHHQVTLIATNALFIGSLFTDSWKLYAAAHLLNSAYHFYAAPKCKNHLGILYIFENICRAAHGIQAAYVQPQNIAEYR